MSITIKGFIANVEKNPQGYWRIGVGVGKDTAGKTQFKNISFGAEYKTDVLMINGVEPKKGMNIEAEVDGQYNTFVSGSVKEAPKSGFGGGKPGFAGKGTPGKGYDSTGQAVGGAVNRANELIATGIINPIGAGVVAAAQYVFSELLKKAADDNKLGTFCTIMKDVDVNDYRAVTAAKKAYIDATASSSAAATSSSDGVGATQVQDAVQNAPQKTTGGSTAKASKPAPVPAPEPDPEDDCPFDDAPDF